jgi:hypothetical protein
MAVDKLLSRLENVKRTGPGRWIARCPAHADKRASLSVRELEDGRILVHDFAGCSVQEVVAAVGLDMAALFPEREIQHGKPERRPIPATDILKCCAFEALVVSAAASAMLAGEPLASVDRERLKTAAARLQAAVKAGGLAHG